MTVRFSGDIRMNLSSNKYKKEGDLFVLEEKFVAQTGGVLPYPFGFAPTFHKYRLNTLENKKNGFNIFVGAMADIFGDWVPDEWINEVFKVCEKYEQHNYLFLTKYPDRYIKLEEQKKLPWRDNFWFGTSVTKQEDPFAWFEDKKFHWFVSIEPLMERIEIQNMAHMPEWIIIGAETGRRKDKTVPEWEWIRKIVLEADSCGVPVFMKDSLISIVGEQNMRREFPEQLKRQVLSPKLRDKLEGDCCRCGKHMKKSEMITMAVRSKRGEMPKQLCHMCRECFIGFCNEMKIEIPKLINFKEDE